jgi:hypothetical protein
MFAIKYKMHFRTLAGVLALIMLILPEVIYGARGGQAASDGRQQATQPAQQGMPSGRTAPVVSAPRAVSRPQRAPDFANVQARQSFSVAGSNRDSSIAGMRFDRTQVRTENRNLGLNRRFGTAQPSPGSVNVNQPQRENFSNRSWTRAQPDVSPQTKPTPSADKPSNRGMTRFDTGGKGRKDIGTWRREVPSVGKDSKLPDSDRSRGTGNIDRNTAISKDAAKAAPDSRSTQRQFSERTRDDSRFAWRGGDNRHRRATIWSRDRDDATLKVVDNVPDAVNTQRGSWWIRTKDFFGHDGHHNNTVFRHRNDFAFYGRNHHHRHHRFISHRIIWPDFFFVTYFDYGPWYSYRPIYPYYHRRYIFVNPYGYWPYDYSYIRYYWYGTYPYYWYGYNPIPYEYGSDTYNYYSYNYYGSDSTGPVTGSLPDYTAQQPAPETTADQYFDDGVKAFEAGDYNTAVAKFALARQLAPDDKVLVFAYSQAYFAVGDYTSAAQVLRAAVAKVNPVEEGVFYPRGLYSSDDILLKQIEDLGVKASQNKQDTDLQFLLGYQYLGLGELDKAKGPLNNATIDSLNGPPANALLQLLDKLPDAQAEAQTQTPAPEESD